MAQFCVKCNKKLGIFSGYKCKDAYFCSSCIAGLGRIYIDNLIFLTANQIEDILLLSDNDDELVKNGDLEESVKSRITWIKRMNECKKDLNRIESDYRKECNEINRHWDNELRETENDFKEYRKKNGGRLNSNQRQNYERMKQEIEDFREADMNELNRNYLIDKEAMSDFHKEASENVEKENEKLSVILEKIKERADIIREEKNKREAEDSVDKKLHKDSEYIKEKDEERELEKARIQAEQQAREEAKAVADKKVKEELEQIKKKAEKEAVEKARIQAEQQAKEEAKTVADKKVKEELEQIKKKAEKEAFEEAKERAELKAKQEAEKLLKKSENEKKRREAKEARKNNPTHLAILSLVCSIASWFSIMLVFPPFLLAIMGIVFGIKGRKSDKKKIAWAGIIISSLLILFFVLAMIVGMHTS